MITYYITLGVLGVAATVLALAVKNLAKVQLGQLLGYLLVFIVLLGLSAGLSLLELSPTQEYGWLAAWGVGMGIVHSVFMYRILSWTRSELLLREGLLTLVIGLAGLLGFVLIVALLRSSLPPLALSGALLGFLLPFWLQKAFQLWKSIPPPLFATWQYPQDQPAPEFTFEQTIPVRLNFSKSPRQSDSTLFTVVAPTASTFGDLFHSFIIDYNRQFAEQPIQAYEPPHEWVFFVHPPRWWQRKKLVNPSLDITQNQLHSNQVVSAVRVSYQ